MAHDLEKKWRSRDVQLQENADFSSLLLSDRVLYGLKKGGFKKPSPIQLEAIPLSKIGKDLLVQAKSGTGKTLVFAVTALEMLRRKLFRPQVLILVPTREIATQICSVIKSIGSGFPKLTCGSFIGGMSLADDTEIARTCQIVVGTPGRLKQLISDKILPTNSIRLLVFDEADRLLQLSFKEEINCIFNSLPDDKQVIATSATYPEKLKKLLLKFLREPHVACLNSREIALLGIIHYAKVVQGVPLPLQQYKQKLLVLEDILKNVKFSQCLVFCNGIQRVEVLYRDIKKWGFSVTYISSAKEQADRLKAIERLRNFKCKILVTSDLTSRGIDAENVDLVANFDLAFDTETYMHRAGRAGRYGSIGVNISIVEDKQLKFLQVMEKEACFKTYILPEPIPKDLIQNRYLGEYVFKEKESESEEEVIAESVMTKEDSTSIDDKDNSTEKSHFVVDERVAESAVSEEENPEGNGECLPPLDEADIKKMITSALVNKESDVHFVGFKYVPPQEDPESQENCNVSKEMINQSSTANGNSEDSKRNSVTDKKCLPPLTQADVTKMITESLSAVEKEPKTKFVGFKYDQPEEGVESNWVTINETVSQFFGPISDSCEIKVEEITSAKDNNDIEILNKNSCESITQSFEKLDIKSCLENADLSNVLMGEDVKTCVENGHEGDISDEITRFMAVSESDRLPMDFQDRTENAEDDIVVSSDLNQEDLDFAISAFLNNYQTEREMQRSDHEEELEYEESMTKNLSVCVIDRLTGKKASYIWEAFKNYKNARNEEFKAMPTEQVSKVSAAATSDATVDSGKVPLTDSKPKSPKDSICETSTLGCKKCLDTTSRSNFESTPQPCDCVFESSIRKSSPLKLKLSERQRDGDSGSNNEKIPSKKQDLLLFDVSESEDTELEEEVDLDVSHYSSSTEDSDEESSLDFSDSSSSEDCYSHNQFRTGNQNPSLVSETDTESMGRMHSKCKHKKCGCLHSTRMEHHNYTCPPTFRYPTSAGHPHAYQSVHGYRPQQQHANFCLQHDGHRCHCCNSGYNQAQTYWHKEFYNQWRHLQMCVNSTRM